jgi:tetratricopeptide (TPR) repeat protein
MKIEQENHLIECHNSWTGAETVYLNGQMVSSKSSILGTSHYFETIEAGTTIRYILTSKIGHNLRVKLDLIRNGVLVQENITLEWGSSPETEHKRKGILKLKQYDLKEALSEFRKAEKINPKDPEVYFHMACVYSLMENTRNGFDALKKSVETSLLNQEDILTHDMLAFLRIQPEFKAFHESGFTAYHLSDNSE